MQYVYEVWSGGSQGQSVWIHGYFTSFDQVKLLIANHPGWFYRKIELDVLDEKGR